MAEKFGGDVSPEQTEKEARDWEDRLINFVKEVKEIAGQHTSEVWDCVGYYLRDGDTEETDEAAGIESHWRRLRTKGWDDEDINKLKNLAEKARTDSYAPITREDFKRVWTALKEKK